jgi:hypothetical protein
MLKTNEKELEKKFKELHLKAIEELQKTEEYEGNKQQIDVIRKTLIKHGGIPQQLIDWLISAVSMNLTLESEYVEKYVIRYASKKMKVFKRK